MTTAESPRARPERARLNWVPLAVLGGILLLALGVWALMTTRPQPTAAVRRDIVAYLSSEGQAVAPPTEQATLQAPFTTTVKKVHASVGDRVDRGDLLVELTMPSHDAALAAAQQAVNQAKQALEDARTAASSPVEAAKQELAAAKAREKAAREALKAQAGGDGTTVSITPATSPELQAAAAEVAAARAALEAAQRDVAGAIEPARQQYEAAVDYLQEVREGRAQGMIRAPLSGTVLALNAKPGETVGQERDEKKPLAYIVDLDELQVHAPVSPEEMPYVKQGMPVKLQFAEIPNKQFAGEVVQITSNADRKGNVTSYTAIVGFRNDEGLVKPGNKAKVSLKLGAVEDVVAVPSEAVDRDDTGQYFVQVRRGDQWVRVPVKIGLSDGTYTEIKEGVREGETVQLTPSLLGDR